MKGFTLIELMIIIAILGILAAIALPSLVKEDDEGNVIITVPNAVVIEYTKEKEEVEKKEERSSGGMRRTK